VILTETRVVVDVLGVSFVYEAEFTIYDVKGFDILLGDQWMSDSNRRYQIDLHSNTMWIADNLWAEREDGQVHYLPGLCPLDIDEGRVEKAKFMGIHIIRKAALKNLSTRLLKRDFLIKMHHYGDGDTLPTEPPGECQDMLTEIQGLFGEPTYANRKTGRQTDFEINTEPNGKIPFRSPYRVSPREDIEVWKQIDTEIRCDCIQLSRSDFGSPVVFVLKPDVTLRMWIDYCAVHAITVQDCYPLPHIEHLLNSVHGPCWFTQLHLVACYRQICIATADRQNDGLYH